MQNLILKILLSDTIHVIIATMNLQDYGIYPYRKGAQIRYFIVGVHGNFHIGSTDFINEDMRSFIKNRGGIMKTLNPLVRSDNAEEMFSLYGCKEVLLGRNNVKTFLRHYRFELAG